VTIAIPRELPRPEQIALVHEYVQTNYVAAGMIADINLHHLDGDNPHAHILLSMRDLQTSSEGIVSFGLKNTDWNSKELLLSHRKSWEEITNQYLAEHGLDLSIDCRSLKDQSSKFIPQIHVGVHATAMHRRGLPTDRRDEFDRIEAANNNIRARLEIVYRQEYPSPEPELSQEEEKEEYHKLGKSALKTIQSYIPVNPEDFLRKRIPITKEYRAYQSQDNRIEFYLNSGTKVLKLDFKNERWTKISTKIDRPIRDINQEYESYKIEVSAQISRENQLARSIDSLLNKWGWRTFYPDDIELTFHRYREDELSLYTDGNRQMNGRIYNFKLIGDNWFSSMKPVVGNYSFDRLVEMVKNQHDRFDRGEIQKLELSQKEFNQINDFTQWRGLELNDCRIEAIRQRARELSLELSL
jgi:MobA/MobL family